MNQTFKTIVLDDHILILNGFQSMLSTHPNLKINKYTSFQEMSDSLEYETADLLITDLFMPEMDGLQVIQWIRNKNPTIKTILYTQTINQRIYHECLRLKVNGYLLKTESQEDLISYITDIIHGKTMFSKEVLKFKTKEDTPKLKEIELKILQLITTGKSMKETSDTLSVSEKIVEYRMRKLRKQFDCKNNTELIYKIKEKYL